MSNRAGRSVVNLSGDAAYESYVPNPLPPTPPLTLSQRSVDLEAEISKHIEELKAFASDSIARNYLQNCWKKECLSASIMEGFAADIRDILNPYIDLEIYPSVKEVVNYIDAFDYSISRLETFPLCNRLIREAYTVTMEGREGLAFDAKDFRHTQNWVGGQCCTLSTARYIPPSPKDMEEALDALEAYININDSLLSTVVRSGLIYYQLETIHPFLNSNSRIAKLLATLFVINETELSIPVLYMSEFLFENRMEYHESILRVRATGDYEQWIEFYLSGLSRGINQTLNAIDALRLLRDANLEALHKLDEDAELAVQIFNLLEQRPIISKKDALNILGLDSYEFDLGIDLLCSADIVTDKASPEGEPVYFYDKYIAVLEATEMEEI